MIPKSSQPKAKVQFFARKSPLRFQPLFWLLWFLSGGGLLTPPAHAGLAFGTGRTHFLLVGAVCSGSGGVLLTGALVASWRATQQQLQAASLPLPVGSPSDLEAQLDAMESCDCWEPLARRTALYAGTGCISTGLTLLGAVSDDPLVAFPDLAESQLVAMGLTLPEIKAYRGSLSRLNCYLESLAAALSPAEATSSHHHVTGEHPRDFPGRPSDSLQHLTALWREAMQDFPAHTRSAVLKLSQAVWNSCFPLARCNEPDLALAPHNAASHSP